MKISKIITAVVLFLIISFGLLYGVPKIIPMELSIAYSQAASSTLIYGLAITVSVSYVVLSYRKSYTKTDIPKKKYEFYYETFDEEQRQILDKMPEEDKYRFVSEYEKVISDEKKRVLQDKVFDWEHGFVPKSLKPLRVMAMLLLVGSIAYTSLGVWKAMEEPVTLYLNKQLEPMQDGIYYYDGLPPVDIQLGTEKGNTLKRDIDGTLLSIKKNQPKFLIDSCSLIHIYNKEKFDSLKPHDWTYAFANSADNSINLNSYDSGTNQPTITHELFHVYNFKTGLEYTNEAIDLYNKYASKVSSYARTNVSEFLSESAERYWHESASLKSDAPEVWEYMDMIFNQ